MKTNIEFTGLSIPTQNLEKSFKVSAPAPREWTRVQFIVPNTYSAPEAVEKWLNDHIEGKWRSFSFGCPIQHDHSYMVVKFQHEHDAIIFKLSGGHQAYENLE